MPRASNGDVRQRQRATERGALRCGQPGTMSAVPNRQECDHQSGLWSSIIFWLRLTPRGRRSASVSPGAMMASDGEVIPLGIQ